jgi:tetratricopeptide (TPR) repeat protein
VLRALRVVVVAAVAIGLISVAAQFGRWLGLAVAALVFGVGLALAWLPRGAHRAFRAGEVRRARMAYRVLRSVMFDRWARAAVDVSLAACDIAREEYARALAALERVDPAHLAEPVRAAWLNNRAYALARLREQPEQALSYVTEAIDLRPQVAGFRHTRGIALLSAGRVDEAIRELDAVWRSQRPEDESPLLEAERCYDLGMAWMGRGEADYAADYFERATRAAPASAWAQRAALELARREAEPPRLTGLGDLL